ncbi:MAG: hypothetical protein ABI981_12640 [Betaproteobacteria bacterium]
MLTPLRLVLKTAQSGAMVALWLAPAACALSAQPAVKPGTASTVYKCSSAGSGVVYQDTPCAPGAELRNFATDPPTLSVIPGSAGAPAQAAAPAPRSERATIAVRTREQPANVGERRYIRVGMTQAEVVARIGKPDIDAHGRRGKGQRWSYLPRGGDPNTITTVTLVDGRVADVERRVVR